MGVFSAITDSEWRGFVGVEENKIDDLLIGGYACELFRYCEMQFAHR